MAFDTANIEIFLLQIRLHYAELNAIIYKVCNKYFRAFFSNPSIVNARSTKSTDFAFFKSS
jgi:hypothetical protein